MRIQWGACVAVILSMVLGARIAGADDVQEQLAEMSERMEQLEDQLRATQDQLTVANEQVQHQQAVIERAGLANDESGVSGLSAFLDTVEVGGLVAGSFLYNLNDPSEGIQAGTVGLRAFDADSQSFNFDQLIFQLGKASTTESRAGFGVELLYGKSAALLTGGNTTLRDDDDLAVTEAYISYLVPELADGVSTTFKAGKFYTLVGSEVLQTNQNYNISRGLLYTLLQPIDHTGATLTFGFAEAIGIEGTAELELGVVNSFAGFDNGPDFNDEKTFLGQLRYGREDWSVAIGGLFGGEVTGGDPESKLALVDLTATFSPAEGVDLWANLDWSRVEIRNNPFDSDPDAWGISLGGHVEITERLGAALRAEYVRDDEAFLGQQFGSPFPGPAPFAPFNSDTNLDNEIWGLTGTVDYALTNHLMVRGEVRYDKVDNDSIEDIFPDEQRPGGFADTDQTTVAVEAVYSF